MHYRTSADSPALQWLTPAQTAGKKQPYLFNQSEPILTRTWIPTQDSPGIRQTWSARVVAPAALTVVMSAEMLGPQPGATPDTRVWRFNMEHPVAPYLIAIAIGDISFQSLGKRTGVYTRAFDAAGRRRGTRGCREDDRGGGSALRPVSLGSL